ncbi:MAG: carboxypeptidase-like regulatory domain-containing protein [Flavobacteriaceae bacterium]|nr:carboxypeptidase-like regulatory domain-containing protein [Flavobacteriaceae bacterium]
MNFFILLAGITVLRSQEISAMIKDSLTKEVIPFANIYLSSGKGILSNEEGVFRIQLNDQISSKDSLSISCMGYKTVVYPVSKFKDSIIFLPSKTIALGSIILSNKNLSAEDIIKEVKKNIAEKYELDLTHKKIFFRESGSQEFKKLRVKVKKSSIKEFNQAFWDSTLLKIPRKNEWHTEVSGSLYGDFSKDNQKLEIDRALELEDKKTTAIFNNIETAFDTILKQNIKKDSYFKLRMGLISTKLEDVELNSSEKDTLTPDEKLVKEKESFSKRRKRIITNIISVLFEKEMLSISVLKKSNRYDFERVDFTYLNNIPVYILKFKPSGNVDYAGKLYIDADKMTLLRAEYKNIKDIRDISLLGFSFKHYFKEIAIQFKKTASGKYALQYLEAIDQFETGVNRAFSILEKNKVVKGRNKQNELKMELNFRTNQFQKYQMVVFESERITQEIFDAFKEKPSILPVNLIQYDPTFWEGYTIIEPNQVIKKFKVDD